MNADLRDNLRRLLLRTLVALPFYGLGFWLMSGLCTAFYGGALMIIGACIIAFPAAELFGRPLMSLYYPTESGPASPNYSIPAVRVKQGRYEEAMQEYAAIARQHPTEVLAYTAMIGIAFKHLHDREWANAVYRQGMEALTSREQQAKLHQLYMAYRSWAENPPH